MKYDTIIIGGGLAGLISGIRLCREGQRCAIISQGQSALHFSSGSFDLLNRLPDSTQISSPMQAYEALCAISPKHPYSKLGKDRFGTYCSEAPRILAEASIATKGDRNSNHFRITPFGEPAMTWLTIKGYLTLEEISQWERVAIFNIAGFLDFYPYFIAEALSDRGIICKYREINLHAFDALRTRACEMRSPNIARILDDKAQATWAAKTIQAHADGCDAIILPAVVGLYNDSTLQTMQNEVSVPIRLLATMPPSIPGIRAQQKLIRAFKDSRGEYFQGDTVKSAQMHGDRIEGVFTSNHGDIPFEADNFILATGSFFSKGLSASRDNVRETVFGLDTDFITDRRKWWGKDFFDRHNCQSFGIMTGNDFKALKNGHEIDNLYVAGAGLGAFDPLYEGSGAGVSILTAMAAADNILRRRKK